MTEKIWTIILAAGAATRFGSVKALAEWKDGKSLLERAISVAPDPSKVVVIAGAHVQPVQDALSADIPLLINENWEEGMGTSISCGINYVAVQGGDIALVLPVDQPLVNTDHLRTLADQATRIGRCVLTQDEGVSGPPAAVPACYFDALKSLTGGGLKKSITDFELIDGPDMMHDVDTPEELSKLKFE